MCTRSRCASLVSLPLGRPKTSYLSCLPPPPFLTTHDFIQQVDALPCRAEQQIAPAVPTTRPGSADAGDSIDVSHLVDGLRSGAPPPMVSNPREHVGSNGHNSREATLERKSDASPDSDSNRDRESDAPAPFHSHVWGSLVTAAAPCEDGGEGKLARAGAAAASAGNSDRSSDRSSGPDAAP